MATPEIASAVAEQKPQTVQGNSRAGLLGRPVGWTISIAVFLAIGILRIVATYPVFNHTIDEPSHIAGGIEWWEKGTYTLEPKHTPLARVSVALGPYLAGVRGTGATRWQDTYPILSENGQYWRNLTLGRLGVLPYFVIATLAVFFWTKRLYGARAGLIAAGIFTLLPTILAHSSNATTDVALTAMFGCSLYAFTWWLREPNFRSAALFGMFTGLALATKLSTLVFLPACGLPILIAYARSQRTRWRDLLKTAAVVVLAAFLSLWAVYRFSHAPLSQATGLPDRITSKLFGKESRITSLEQAISRHVPVPAPEFLDGIRMLRDQNRQGSRGYLLGRVKDGGWWYFFFVAVAVKTPIAVLLLAGLGAFLSTREFWRDPAEWESAAPLASFVMLMLVTMPSHLDSGVRYVLPVYVCLSVLAGIGVAALWQYRNPILGRVTAAVLFLWLVGSSAFAHPDYLSYFNQFAGKDPSYVIVVGDLDWGQDYTRLATYLREHSIQQISIASDTFFEAKPLGLPETTLLKCSDQPTGWVAMELRRVRLHPECYQWMAQEQLVTTVGKTMLIYNVPAQNHLTSGMPGK